METAQAFVLGAIAAVSATVIIQPIDFVKVRLQLATTPSTPLAVVQHALRDGGVRALYTGLPAAVWRQVVYGSARLGLFRVCSDRLRVANDGAPISLLQKVGVGLVTGAVAAYIGTPFDLVLVRMQADATFEASKRRNYKSVGEALVRTAREEGVANLWRGSSPTVTRAAVVNASMMASNEQIKERVGPLLGGEKSAATSLVAALAAGIISCTA